jgi:hypothetical protein
MLRRPFRCLVISLVIGACAGASPVPTTSPAPIQLFNGRDITAWTWVPRPPRTSGPATQPADISNPFTVRDGILHCAGKPIGYLRTADDYGDNFILTVEQRHINKGNGGIFFALTGVDKVWPHCIEAQGQVGEEGDLRGIVEFKLTTDPARTEPKRLRRIGPSSEKPIGEWETIQIVVNHGKVSVTVNDQLQNVATFDPSVQSMRGRIAVQAEGGEMEFRRIELTPIEP